ncbi:Dicarboxylate transporter 2.1, chloroplastic [Vitis vinifera]|uniref:Dicarboxylate transporter 2.1, chloroplastic n=1 Tax=Vitis vinifera TaxID=29760 RepID=A0A438DWK4_VITVI|nr:Dicarboxylate transporter 2.1, chloroplastic [Vitis vinifera]
MESFVSTLHLPPSHPPLAFLYSADHRPPSNLPLHFPLLRLSSPALQPPITSLAPSPPLALFKSKPSPKPRTFLHPIQASPSPPPPPVEESPKGAKLIPFIISISIGLIVRFLVPKPVQVSMQAWQLLAIFLSTVAGLVLNPLPVGAWAFLGLTTSILTNTLSFSTASGRSPTSEILIAPAMPSTTARAGGIYLPIIKSLSLSVGSKPGDPSARKLGAYLVQSQFQSAGNSSALFLTAAAQNMLCLKLAEEVGVIVSSPWVSWFRAASVPALVSLLLSPFILYNLYPPEIKDTPDAPAMAAKRLEHMGSVTRDEWVMIGTMILAVSLWVFG